MATNKTPSRIPRLHRSSSFANISNNGTPVLRRKLSTPAKSSFRTPPCPDEEGLDDVASLSSVGSAISCQLPNSAYSNALASSWSQRRNPRYAFHCSHQHDHPQEYLTPTQRANRQIKMLKKLLAEAEMEIQYRDFEIQRLTKELVEARLERAERPNGQRNGDINPAAEDLVDTVAKPATEDEKLLHLPFQPSSLTDSGHFDDLATPSPAARSVESFDVPVRPPVAVAVDDEDDMAVAWISERRKLLDLHQRQLDDVRRNHVDELQILRERLTDKVELALKQLSEANSRYADLVSELHSSRDREKALILEVEASREKFQQLRFEFDELTQEKIEREQLLACLRQQLAEKEQELHVVNETNESQKKELETLGQQIQTLQDALKEQEAKHQNVYLQMYRKGQEAARFENEKDCTVEVSEANSADNVSKEQLLNKVKTLTAQLEELKVLYNQEIRQREEKDPAGNIEKSLPKDPEVTLRFLRSAVFYLLTDPQNHEGHSRALQSILNFSCEERHAVEKAQAHRAGYGYFY